MWLCWFFVWHSKVHSLSSTLTSTPYSFIYRLVYCHTTIPTTQTCQHHGLRHISSPSKCFLVCFLLQITNLKNIIASRIMSWAYTGYTNNLYSMMTTKVSVIEATVDEWWVEQPMTCHLVRLGPVVQYFFFSFHAFYLLIRTFIRYYSTMSLSDTGHSWQALQVSRTA